MELFVKFSNLLNEYRKSQCNIFIVLFKYLYYKIFYKKNIIAHQNVTIIGVNNIITKDNLNIGAFYVGFSMKNDKTLLNIQGKMYIGGSYCIGRGCRIDIDKNAVLKIGNGGFINVNTFFIISHGLQIGNDCSISWGCQFIDNDFHQIDYENKKERPYEIIIGNHVWVGCNVCILKGSVIPDNCVIAANSVVTGIFSEESVLIGGNPAKVIKRNISWQA